jgi:hypothetical protein
MIDTTGSVFVWRRGSWITPARAVGTPLARGQALPLALPIWGLVPSCRRQTHIPLWMSRLSWALARWIAPMPFFWLR